MLEARRMSQSYRRSPHRGLKIPLFAIGVIELVRGIQPRQHAGSTIAGTVSGSPIT